MFEWRNEYSVQIGSVDSQHRMLFGLAQELYTAMMAGRSRASVAHILGRLVQYTEMHFAHEERLLEQHAYPGLPAHRAQHRALTLQVLKFQADFTQGKVNMSVHLLQFLRDWLDRHIRGSDQQYALFLRSRQVA